MGPLQRAFPDCPVCSSNPKPSSPSSYHHFLRALITTIITMAFLCGHAYCPAWGPHVGQGLGLSPSALAHVPGLCGPRYNYSQVSIKETDWLTDCSAETQSWLLFGKIWGSSECQLVKVTEEPLDHSKETGILLLLKPIHVSDAFPSPRRVTRNSTSANEAMSVNALLLDWQECKASPQVLSSFWSL